jgi:hypothetical protein
MRTTSQQLPPSLTPVAEFRVDGGRQRAQRFACLPNGFGEFDLVVVSKRGYRSVGQWSFKTWKSAERWATQQVNCNGPFHVY